MTHIGRLAAAGMVFWAANAAAAWHVVIDPGHGGSNTGAPGRVERVYEKQVTLAVARALKARLLAAGVEVTMTRDHDQYLTLRQRSRMANAVSPSLFVSLHTNASPDHSRRGIETYVLDRDAADLDARRRAARATDDVTGVIADLEQLETIKRSIALARSVQQTLVFGLGGESKANRGVKQAVYDVLSGLEMPAILVEIGFIDHPIEGVALAERETQERLAVQLADGITGFLKGRSAVRVAQLP